MNKDRKIKNRFYDAITKTFKKNRDQHIAYMPFPQYVSIVQEFIEWFVTDKKWREPTKKLSIFTGLCITPLQWFNYNLIPKEGKNVIDVATLADIEHFWTDEDWLGYHKFLIRLRCNNFGGKCPREVKHDQCIQHQKGIYCETHQDITHVNFHRHILTIDDNIVLNENFILPKTNVVKSQLNDVWINLPQNNDLVYKCTDLVENNSLYKNQSNNTLAYLMRDNEQGNYEKLGIVFRNYFQSPRFSNIVIENNQCKIRNPISQDAYNLITSSHLPLDFITFGYEDNSVISPIFALGCEVFQRYVKIIFIDQLNPKLANLVTLVNDYLKLG